MAALNNCVNESRYYWRKKQEGWGAVAPPSCQPSGPKPRKIFILLGLDIFRFCDVKSTLQPN